MKKKFFVTFLHLEILIVIKTLFLFPSTCNVRFVSMVITNSITFLPNILSNIILVDNNSRLIIVSALSLNNRYRKEICKFLTKNALDIFAKNLKDAQIQLQNC